MKITTTILILFLFSIIVTGQNSYGYFDFDSIFIYLPENKTFNDSINLRRQQIKDTIDIMTKEYKSFNFGDTNWITSQQRKVYDREVDDLQRRFNTYKSTAYNRIDQAISDRKKVILESIKNSINEFYEINDIVMLADKKAVLFCDNCKDFSRDIIEYIKNKK